MTTGLCWTSLGRAASPDQIQTAIHKGVAFLYSQQNGNGNWEKSQTRQPIKGNGSGIDDGQWGGRSALATYALLTAGERPLDDRIVKATDWLRQAPLDGIYAIGMRANVWESLPASPANLNALRADGKKLASSLGPPNTKYSGTYDYFVGQKFNRLDISVSQYGVLGMWAVAQRLEGTVLPQYWMLVEQAWHRLQQPDGGWTYYGEPGGGFSTSIQMTAAGVASLFITQEFLHSNDGVSCKGNVSNEAIDKGMKWITKNLDKIATDQRYDRDYPYPTLYAIEKTTDVDVQYQRSLGSRHCSRTASPSGRSSTASCWTCSASAFSSPGRAGLGKASAPSISSCAGTGWSPTTPSKSVVAPSRC